MSDDLYRQGDRRSALFEALAESVVELSDEETVEEARESGEDPSASARQVRSLLLKAVDASRPEPVAAAPVQADAPADAPLDTTTYLLEVRLTRTSKPASEKKGGRGLGLRLLLGGDRTTPEDDRPRRTPPWLALAATAAGLAVAAGSVAYLVREPASGRVEQAQEAPAPPANEPSQSEAPPTDSTTAGHTTEPEHKSPNRPKRPIVPRSEAPDTIRPDVRSGTRSALEIAEIRTIFVDPQTTAFATSVRDALVTEIDAGRRMSVTQDRAAADARLRIDRADDGRVTVSLVGGRSVLWSATERVDGAGAESASLVARRIVDRLLDAAGH